MKSLPVILGYIGRPVSSCLIKSVVSVNFSLELLLRVVFALNLKKYLLSKSYVNYVNILYWVSLYDSVP